MEENNLPPGFRFHPTDEELINYYLISKVSDSNGFTCKAIAVVDLNKSEPWDLPGKASMGEKVWYFFSLRDRKYPTGLRTNRATESGYWKTTGKDKHIFHGGALVGFKKTLVFYQGRAPRGLKSNWVMHEYRLHNNIPHFTPSKEEWVVCRVFQKSISAAKKPHQEITSPSQQDSPCDATSSMVNELGDMELTNFRFTNNINSNNDADQSNNNINTNMNLSNNYYWASTSPTAAALLTDQVIPSLVAWPNNSNNANLMTSSVNSLLLKALQLKSYHQLQQQQANNNNQFEASSSSYMSSQAVPNNLNGGAITHHDHVISNLTASHQHQPFNIDSLW